jgi:hypothetical protein
LYFSADVSRTNTEFAKIVGRGITLVAASGDQGGYFVHFQKYFILFYFQNILFLTKKNQYFSSW